MTPPRPRGGDVVLQAEAEEVGGDGRADGGGVDGDEHRAEAEPDAARVRGTTDDKQRRLKAHVTTASSCMGSVGEEVGGRDERRWYLSVGRGRIA